MPPRTDWHMANSGRGSRKRTRMHRRLTLRGACWKKSRAGLTISTTTRYREKKSEGELRKEADTRIMGILRESPRLKRPLAHRLSDSEQQERRNRYEKKSARAASSAESSTDATEGRGGERRSERRNTQSSSSVRRGELGGAAVGHAAALLFIIVIVGVHPRSSIFLVLPLHSFYFPQLCTLFTDFPLLLILSIFCDTRVTKLFCPFNHRDTLTLLLIPLHPLTLLLFIHLLHRRLPLLALGLLPDLHGVFLPQLLLAPLVVLHLVGELRLVLRPDQVGPRPLHQAQLPELQLLGRLVVPQQHRALQVLQGLLLVQLLGDDKGTRGQGEVQRAYVPVHTALCIRPCAYGPVHTALCIRPSAYGPLHTALCTRPSAHGPLAPETCLSGRSREEAAVVARQQHLPLVLATLQLVVLPLAPQKPRLLLRLQLLQTLLLVHQPLLLLPLRGRLVLIQLLERRKEDRLI
ncbi:hypothetical protein EYF80_025639 [Liparis tanakae]|uniref:Uncharacterized protein n=1 Tax=Liparis tanakae TaxID=230148 RepID=A0A4Z2HEU3_9TELE|nr:hypothetical protein EYF80_025639 [Liparis tanakae]